MTSISSARIHSNDVSSDHSVHVFSSGKTYTGIATSSLESSSGRSSTVQASVDPNPSLVRHAGTNFIASDSIVHHRHVPSIPISLEASGKREESASTGKAMQTSTITVGSVSHMNHQRSENSIDLKDTISSLPSPRNRSHRHVDEEDGDTLHSIGNSSSRLGSISDRDSSSSQPFFLRFLSANRFGVAILFAIYIMSSIAMTLLNKQIARSSGGLVMGALAIQNIATVFLSLFLERLLPHAFPMSPWRVAHFRTLLLPTLLFFGLLWSSLVAMEKAPVALVVVFRNLNPAILAVAERIIYSTMIPRHRWFSLGLLTLGACVYTGIHQTSFSTTTVAWTIANTLITTALALIERQVIRKLQSEQTVNGIQAYRALSVFPLFLIGSIYESWGSSSKIRIVNYDDHGKEQAGLRGALSSVISLTRACGMAYVDVAMPLFLSVFFAFSLGWSFVSLQSRSLSISISVSNVAAKLLTVVVGTWWFRETLSGLSALGIFLSFVGLVLYSSDQFLGNRSGSTLSSANPSPSGTTSSSSTVDDREKKRSS